MNLLVIVPSRGRPGNCRRLADAFERTAKADTTLLVAVDIDDPQLESYTSSDYGSSNQLLVIQPRMRMGPTLNHTAIKCGLAYDAIGFLGDDHLPQTDGWDQLILDELARLGTGLAYGNDLLQGQNLPTAVFMTSNIVRTLGWMAPPGLIHLFLDDAWLTLGRALNAITYLPDVIIEHCHPLAGKAEQDAGYTECNTSEIWKHDEQIFNTWKTEQLVADVEKIRAAAHG